MEWSEQLSSGLLRAALDAIVVTDDQGSIVLVNAQAEELFGYPHADLLGRPVEVLVPDRYRTEYAEHRRRTVAEPRPGPVGYLRLPARRCDGREFPSELSLSAVRTDHGRLVVAVIRDITDLLRADEERRALRAEAERQRLEAQLHRTRRMESLGQLAGGVAHDFNNLLVAIMGNIQIGSAKTNDLERAQFLNEALSACSRAAELTKQLLAFGRRQHIHEHPLDVHALLDDTLRLLRRLVPETIAIELLKARQLPRVLGDRGQLEQVIVNLCINARDAMPTGGRLVLETEQVVINGKFRETHPWARPGRYVLISVSDTGTGIAPEHIDRIFEPFFTTKEMGTGLGLSSAYGVVKQHGGLLHVYSEPDNGTTFKVYLPVAERDAAEVGSKIEEPVRGGTETILLAEDEAPVRRVVKLILTEAGYTVIEAANGAVAVELFSKTPDAIDLVLLDAVMPEKSGSQAAAEIHAIKPDVALVLSSGYSDVLATDPTAIADIAFLAKPYEPDTLLRVVRRTLDTKREIFVERGT